MPDNSFDIVSKIDLAEVANAIQQAMKEVSTRFDLKDSKSQIAMEGADAIMLHSTDEFKMKAVNDVFQQKLVKRSVPLTGLTYGALEPAAGSTVTQKNPAAGDADREGAGDREAHQEFEEKSAGFHPGRCSAHQQQGSRYTAGNHRDGQAAGLWHRSAVHELPQQLITAATN